MQRYLIGACLAAALLLTCAASAAAAPHAGKPAPRPDPVLRYHGGPVMHRVVTTAVWWRPAGLTYAPGYPLLIHRFLGAVARGGLRPGGPYAVLREYTDKTKTAVRSIRFAGAFATTAQVPEGCVPDAPFTACVTKSQAVKALLAVIAAHRLPHGLTRAYVLFTPRELEICNGGSCSGDGWCGLHGNAGRGPRGVVWALVPYNAATSSCRRPFSPNANDADASIDTLAHEQREMITDPFGNAWRDPWGRESDDLCIYRFGPLLGRTGAGGFNTLLGGLPYLLQGEWSLRLGHCVWRLR